MRIRTQVITSMAVFGLILVAISASVLATSQEVGRLGRQEQIAESIELGARELSYLSNDYLLHRESPQQARWEAKYSSISEALSLLEPQGPEQQALAGSMKVNQERLRAVFNDVSSGLERLGESQLDGQDMAFVRVSWSRLEVQNQGIAFDASRLSETFHARIEEAERTNMLLILALLGIFGAYFLTNYLLVYRRTLGEMSRLQTGTAVIGSGNLDYSIAIKRDDEIGDLARAFNRMTASLKDVTASRVELQAEIAERKKAEESAQRQKRLQEAINRILEAGLTCDTLEDLGTISLTVAEELTESQFGFIARLNAQGLLDDVAISDPGWDACAMESPLGHGRLPHDLAVHGIYGRVLRDGKSLFTNDPANHADRIGTPEGHPAITAFLGVPLAGGGEITGMIGLGNRVGGYRVEDQRTIESLAVAITEAFDRRRAEDEIRQLNDSLSQRAAELEVANKELEAFSYSVSHDLRAPIRHMDSFSKILLEDCGDRLDEHERQYLHHVRNASLKMHGLVEALLALSRVSRTGMQRQAVDLSKMVKSIGAELRAEEEERRAELSVAPGLIVNGDPELLSVLLGNLFRNAWKFTSVRPVARIEFGTTECDGERVYFVRDNGVGFDMAYAGKLFGPFQRLHRDDEFPGTGIGLATAQRVVHRHGGRVWAEAEPDKGATFYFTLQ